MAGSPPADEPEGAGSGVTWVTGISPRTRRALGRVAAAPAAPPDAAAGAAVVAAAAAENRPVQAAPAAVAGARRRRRERTLDAHMLARMLQVNAGPSSPLRKKTAAAAAPPPPHSAPSAARRRGGSLAALLSASPPPAVPVDVGHTSSELCAQKRARSADDAAAGAPSNRRAACAPLVHEPDGEHVALRAAVAPAHASAAASTCAGAAAACEPGVAPPSSPEAVPMWYARLEVADVLSSGGADELCEPRAQPEKVRTCAPVARLRARTQWRCAGASGAPRTQRATLACPVRLCAVPGAVRGRESAGMSACVASGPRRS